MKFVIILLACICLPSLSFAEKERFSVAAGIGTLYGGSLGAQVSYRIVERVDVLGSFGAYGRPSVGLQYHLTENYTLFQPRFSVVYGVNGALDVETEESFEARPFGEYDSRKELFNGVSAGIGTRIGLGYLRKFGVTIDLLYRVDDGGLNARKRELGDRGGVDSRFNGPNDGIIAILGILKTLS